MEENNNNTTGSMEEGGGVKLGGKNKRVVSKIIIILAVLVALGAIYLLVRKGAESGKIGEGAKTEQAAEVAAPPPAEEEQTNAILFTDKGYQPETITIKKGTTVIFVNTAKTPTWPASADHPTHKVYPGSDIAKCGTPEQVNIFDACKGLAENENWTFTFNEVGTWKYHDHLNPSWLGTVVVE